VCGVTHVVEVDVDQKAEPESLEKMKDSALFAIKKSKLQEIAIQEVQKRPHV
jgi:hypothetical protein